MKKIKPSQKQTTEMLYKQIPSFECIPGCTDCCGPILFNKWEWSKIKEKKQAESIDCPYSLKGSCDIYSDRPFICRLYGTVEDLQCPHGRKPEFLLTKEQGRNLTDIYKATFKLKKIING